jgi:hypothetical protein
MKNKLLLSVASVVFRTLFPTYPHFGALLLYKWHHPLKIKKGCNSFIISRFSLVPGTGIEPVQPQRPQDFKSFAFIGNQLVQRHKPCKMVQNGAFPHLFSAPYPTPKSLNYLTI